MDDLLNILHTKNQSAARLLPQWSLASLLLTALVVGCGDSRFQIAPVAGKVLLDGEPVSNARVVFMPRAQGDDREAGYYSQGETDAEGRYRLKTVEKKPQGGAVVGLHRIMITTRRSKIDPNDPDREIVEATERIPLPYSDYRSTPLEWEVPAGGTDAADFELVSTRKRR